MLGRVSFAALFVALGACGGSGGGDDDGGDDAPGIDAPAQQATVIEVSPCPAMPDADVESTGGFRFSPDAVTISQGQVVRFTNRADHSIVPVFPDSDPGLKVGFGATTCLQFTKAGTFNYRCNPHSSMTGTITVN
jgi:plastocyanin